jgi:hypothetical protein
MEMMEQQMLLEQAQIQAAYMQAAAYQRAWSGAMGYSWGWPYWGGGVVLVGWHGHHFFPGNNQFGGMGGGWHGGSVGGYGGGHR